MSRRENQPLQISLVIFVILTIVLSVTSFMLYRKIDEAANKEKEARTQADSWQKQLRAEEAKSTRLCQIIGVGEKEALQQIEQTFAAKVASVSGLGLAEPQKHLVGIIDFTKQAHDKLQGERDLQDQNLIALKTRVDALEAAKNKSLLTHVAEKTTANQNLKTTQEKAADLDLKHKQAIDERQAKVKDLETKTAEGIRKYDELAANSKKKEEVLTKERDAATEKLEALKQKNFDHADGAITYVSQRQGTVWIDRGRADGLSLQTTFSVWGRDTNNFARSSPKANIEVIQILGDHLAEARIMPADMNNDGKIGRDEQIEVPTDPVVPGDLIMTPLWDVGHQDHFAISGFLDVDGDGQSDADLVRALIIRNGGVIDAIMNDDGPDAGKVQNGDGAAVGADMGITSETTFLIIGKPAPIVAGPAGEGNASSADMTKTANKMELAAKSRGVQFINLDRFLQYVGFVPSHPITKFKGITPEKFTQTSEGSKKVAPTNTSGFKKRGKNAKPVKADSAY